MIKPATLWTILCVVLVVATAVVAWFVYKRVFRPRWLARSILRAKASHDPYAETCDMLFDDDPYLGGQYKDMKKHRPELEVLNLCANQAKHLLHRK